ncbi:MAG: hypothetical protein ACXWHJ_10860 [Candidatus Aminicenantales bacterium]
MTARIRAQWGLAAGAWICGLALFAPARPSSPLQDQFAALPLEKTIVVAADAGWVDTAIDVGPGEELHISASGEINLQKGNPEAVCGPAGLDLVTVDQPVPNVNLGALIGKVVQPVARRVDEDSGIEIRDEIFVLFPVGPETTVTVPFKGRLYLGINENVLKDNGGMYSAVVVRRPV